MSVILSVVIEINGKDDYYMNNHTDDNEQPDHNNRVHPRHSSNKSNRTVLFLSAIGGGIISAIIVVLLFTSEFIPLNNNQYDDPQAHAKPDSNITTVAQTDQEIDHTVESSNIAETSEAIVGIINLQQQDGWNPSQEVGAGSGIIYKKEDGKAYIVTNQHVVEGANEIDVSLYDDERVKAKLLGTDELTDLAILQIDGESIETVADLGSSKDLHVGDTVMAIGNPLGMDFANSVTRGIVSGLDRSLSIDTNGDQQMDWITEVIQTDAAINPGNSGGALINIDGEVVGINSMKIARQEVEGIGFAIPIDAAIPIMEQLESKGEVARPFIGISTASLKQVPEQYREHVRLPEGVEGDVVIAEVQPGSAADQAGLKQFDIITAIDDQEITSIVDLRKYMYSETTIGTTLQMEIVRNGKQQSVELELTGRPD